MRFGLILGCVILALAAWVLRNGASNKLHDSKAALDAPLDDSIVEQEPEPRLDQPDTDSGPESRTGHKSGREEWLKHSLEESARWKKGQPERILKVLISNFRNQHNRLLRLKDLSDLQKQELLQIISTFDRRKKEVAQMIKVQKKKIIEEKDRLGDYLKRGTWEIVSTEDGAVLVSDAGAPTLRALKEALQITSVRHDGIIEQFFKELPDGDIRSLDRPSLYERRYGKPVPEAMKSRFYELCAVRKREEDNCRNSIEDATVAEVRRKEAANEYLGDREYEKSPGLSGKLYLIRREHYPSYHALLEMKSKIQGERLEILFARLLAYLDEKD